MFRAFTLFSCGNQSSGEKATAGESPDLSTKMCPTGCKRGFSRRAPIASRVFEVETLEDVGAGAERGRILYRTLAPSASFANFRITSSLLLHPSGIEASGDQATSLLSSSNENSQDWGKSHQEKSRNS